MAIDTPEERLKKINDRLTELAKQAPVDPTRSGTPTDAEIEYCLQVETLKSRLAAGQLDPFDKFFALRCPQCSVVFCFTRHPPTVKDIMGWLNSEDGFAMLCARCGR